MHPQTLHGREHPHRVVRHVNDLIMLSNWDWPQPGGEIGIVLGFFGSAAVQVLAAVTARCVPSGRVRPGGQGAVRGADAGPRACLVSSR